MTTDLEQTIRQRLNIPEAATQVLIFAESSHWDPNWMQTSEDYYRNFIQNNLDQALRLLDTDERRRYSVECAFFLRMYWDRNLQQHERIVSLMNQGRLWMTSSGVTTADTLLPTEEALLRDFLIGQEWLREIGVKQEPTTAYYTDSFGCTPFLPSILNAAGFSRTAFTRIDGMFFMACDFEPAKNFPRSGSSAELLGKTLKTQDFIWRDPNGAEVLSHWNAFNYGQGDMITARGLSKVYLAPYYMNDNSARLVSKRIKQIHAQLAPLAKTPYLFCPIGFDFTAPIPELLEVLDRYNTQEFPNSGIWVVNATLDDYLDLVGEYRDFLPVVENMEPNPYWTGFYTARPYLKKKAHEALDHLVTLERLTLDRPEKNETLKADWWNLAASNHHDLITGTSPDAVMEAESYPWIEGIIANVQPQLPQMSSEKGTQRDCELPTWEKKGDQFIITTNHYRVTLAEELGGCISSYIVNGQEYLEKPSNDLVLYADSGGLWRMGHEFKGGYLRQIASSSQTPAQLSIVDTKDSLRVRCESKFEGETIVRELIFCNDTPLIRGRVIGRAPIRSSLMLRFTPNFTHTRLSMAQPGGVMERPLEKIYKPTYWSMQSFAHAWHAEELSGFALITAQPSAVASLDGRSLECIPLRNATHETAFGLIGIPANPATGYEKQSCPFEYAFVITPQGDWRENHLELAAVNLLAQTRPMDNREAIALFLREQVHIEAAETVVVTALKHAHRGEGLILRLRSYQHPQEAIQVTLPAYKIQQAWLCDARERDLTPLEIINNFIQIKISQSLTTIRMIVD